MCWPETSEAHAGGRAESLPGGEDHLIIRAGGSLDYADAPSRVRAAPP